MSQKLSTPDWRSKRAVLFDMDGVLYDSMPLHSKAWCSAMAEFGYHMTPEDVYRNEGCTGTYTVRRISEREGRPAASEEEVRRIYMRKSELFCGQPQAPLMPGARDVLAKAGAAGLLILVVTGSGQTTLIERVQRDFDGFVRRNLMVTSFDVQRGKPFPDPYLKGLEIGGISADDAVVVENAPLGIRSARAAGIDTIAVNTGPLADEILLKEKPSLLLHSMTELADNWERLFSEPAV